MVIANEIKNAPRQKTLDQLIYGKKLICKNPRYSKGFL